MEMSKREICLSYADALNKRRQIGILADLNEVSRGEIIDILVSRGYYEGQKNELVEKPKPRPIPKPEPRQNQIPKPRQNSIFKQGPIKKQRPKPRLKEINQRIMFDRLDELDTQIRYLEKQKAEYERQYKLISDYLQKGGNDAGIQGYFR